jgi:pyruvate dehydrogenase E1 component alpha subunit
MYSMGTHIARGTSMADDLSAKAHAYGMRYAECDGMDVLDTYDVFKREADLSRGSTAKALGLKDAGEGPCFINAITYRFKGHSMSDPQKYRTKEEVAEREQRDPINRLVNHLIERGLSTQEQIDKLDADAKQQAVDSVKYADQSPDLGVEELYTDVYAMPYGPYKAGELPMMLREKQ